MRQRLATLEGVPRESRCTIQTAKCHRHHQTIIKTFHRSKISRHSIIRAARGCRILKTNPKMIVDQTRATKMVDNHTKSPLRARKTTRSSRTISRTKMRVLGKISNLITLPTLLLQRLTVAQTIIDSSSSNQLRSRINKYNNSNRITNAIVRVVSE